MDSFSLCTDLSKRMQRRALLSATIPNHKGWIMCLMPPGCVDKPGEKEDNSERTIFESRPHEGRHYAAVLAGATLLMLIHGSDKLSLRANPRKVTQPENTAAEKGVSEGEEEKGDSQAGEELQETEGNEEEEAKGKNEAQRPEVKRETKRLLEAFGAFPVDESERRERKRLIPVFCTTEMPLEILNEFLTLPLPREKELSDSFRYVILSKPNTEGIKTHTEAPLTSNPSLHFNTFLNKTPDEVYLIFTSSISTSNNKRSFWASSTFVILDERTREEKTVLLCTDHNRILETVRTDFKTSLWHATPLEMMTMTIKETAWMDTVLGREEGDVLRENAAKTEDEFLEDFVKWRRGEGGEPLVEGIARDELDVKREREEMPVLR